MTNSHLNYLQERLRPVARLVFPSDPVRCVNLSNTNRYTRMYLCAIVQRAKDDPFKLTITNKQLARLFRIPHRKFLQWFCHDIHLPKVFHRARYFIREMIIVNIEEDRGVRNVLSNRSVPENPVDWPSRRTVARWQELIRPMQEEYRNRGPVIESLKEAEELIEWIQSGYSRSSSSESDSESISCGEVPAEERTVDEIECETAEFRGLTGPPAVLTPDQLLEPFKNILIKSDESEDGCSDDNMGPSDTYDQLN